MATVLCCSDPAVCKRKSFVKCKSNNLRHRWITCKNQQLHCHYTAASIQHKHIKKVRLNYKTLQHISKICEKILWKLICVVERHIACMTLTLAKWIPFKAHGGPKLEIIKFADCTKMITVNHREDSIDIIFHILDYYAVHTCVIIMHYWLETRLEFWDLLNIVASCKVSLFHFGHHNSSRQVVNYCSVHLLSCWLHL